MGKRLSSDAVACYHRDGFYFPVPVLSAAEARVYRDRLEAYVDQAPEMIRFLKENDEAQVTFYEGRALSIEPPATKAGATSRPNRRKMPCCTA